MYHPQCELLMPLESLEMDVGQSHLAAAVAAAMPGELNFHLLHSLDAAAAAASSTAASASSQPTVDYFFGGADQQPRRRRRCSTTSWRRRTTTRRWPCCATTTAATTRRRRRGAPPRRTSAAGQGRPGRRRSCSARPTTSRPSWSDLRELPDAAVRRRQEA